MLQFLNVLYSGYIWNAELIFKIGEDLCNFLFERGDPPFWCEMLGRCTSLHGIIFKKSTTAIILVTNASYPASVVQHLWAVEGLHARCWEDARLSHGIIFKKSTTAIILVTNASYPASVVQHLRAVEGLGVELRAVVPEQQDPRSCGPRPAGRTRRPSPSSSTWSAGSPPCSACAADSSGWPSASRRTAPGTTHATRGG